MANISAFNKMLKIQRLLLPITAYAHNITTSCHYGTIAISNERAKPHRQQQHIHAKKQAFCSAASNTIDEFRAREEKREKEYEAQLAEEARREKGKEHDAEEKAKQAKADAIRTKILAAALTHVPSLGWSRAAIVRGAEEVGLPSVVHGMFPEGGYALVSYFYGKCNEQLLTQMQTEAQNEQHKVTDPAAFVLSALRTRLEMILPYKSQWPQALALMTAPQNASTALAQVLTLVDDICYYAGDRSVDMRWYARRIGVATIMKMTELFMLQDNSPGHANTWEFLEARLNEASRLQSLLQSTDGVTHNFQRSFNSAFETARNILGIGYQRR